MYVVGAHVRCKVWAFHGSLVVCAVPRPDDGRYSGFLDCGRKIVKEEGVTALYKGSLNRMMVQAPLFGIALLAFEIQKDFLRKQ